VPVLTGGYRKAAAAVVGAAPVVEQGGIAAVAVVEMAGKFKVVRPTGQILHRRVDEVQADVIFGARPAIGGAVELVGTVVVLMFGAAFGNSGR
jgi:hypothetical protein